MNASGRPFSGRRRKGLKQLMTGSNDWVGSDFQRGPQPDGEVGLCGACRALGACRLGLKREHLGEDGVVRSHLVCPAGHEGGPGVAHGGWTAGVLDELLGHVPMLHRSLSVTKTLEVSFLRPVPIERPLEASAWATRREAGRWYIAGEIRLASTGAELARAAGVFVERDPAHFSRFERWLDEQDRAG
jgi:acyl-coenzyme A thioesterase PaaI-like protein